MISVSARLTSSMPLRGVHIVEHALAAVILRQRPGLALVGPQPLLHDFRPIVRPLHQLAAVTIAKAGHLRRRVVHVVNLAAHAARPAAGKAPDQRIFIDAELNHHRLAEPALIENAVQLLRLRQRPRKPIENEPGFCAFWCSLSSTILKTKSSGTSSPRSMIGLATRPNSVPRL